MKEYDNPDDIIETIINENTPEYIDIQGRNVNNTKNHSALKGLYIIKNKNNRFKKVFH